MSQNFGSIARARARCARAVVRLPAVERELAHMMLELCRIRTNFDCRSKITKHHPSIPRYAPACARIMTPNEAANTPPAIKAKHWYVT